MRGAVRCRMHGGASGQSKRKAQQRLIEQQAARVLADLGEEIEPVTDPLSALEQVAGQAMALVDLLRGKVAELEQIGYPSSQGLEQTRAELSLYLSALGRAESVVGRMLSLDLESRRLRLDEAKAALVVAALSRVLADRHLALDSERQRWARSKLARELGAPAEAKQVSR